MRRREASLQQRRRDTKSHEHAANRTTGDWSRCGRMVVLGVAALGVLAAVLYVQWNADGWSRTQPLPSGSSDVKPPGAPPIDAAATLGLSPELPTTVAQLKAEATSVATRLIALLPERPEPYAQMAMLQSESGFDAEALTYWQQALQHDDKFAAAYLGIGIIHAVRAEYAQAAEMLQQMIQLDPAAPQAYRQLTEVLLKQGKTSEAVALARESVRRFPEVAHSHFLLGQACLQDGDYAEARRCQEAALRINPDWSQPYAPLAQACARLGDREAATRFHRRLAELKKAELEADRQRTRTYDDCTKQREVTAKLHNAAGGLHLRCGDPQLAEAHWLRAAAIARQDTQSRESLLAIYTQQARPSAAVQVLEELAAAEPDDPQHLTQKGSCLIEMGRWSEARQSLQQAARLQPDFAPAHLLLATTYLASGDDLAAAQRHAQKAVALTHSSQAFLVLAAVLQQEGDLRGARTTLEKAVAADPDNRDLRHAYEQLLATD